MEDILYEINAIGNILYNVMLRISPTNVADFFVSKGRTYGKLLTPEEAFGILLKTPIEIRDGILSSIGCFLKIKKALDNNDSEEFVKQCEACNNASDLLYACGYISEFRDGSLILATPEDNSFYAVKAVKNAYVNDYDPNEIFSPKYIVRILAKGAMKILPYATDDEKQDVLVGFIRLRPYEDCYFAFLEVIIEKDSGLAEFREIIRGLLGEDEVETSFLSGNKEEWHLPKNIFDHKKQFKSFEVISDKYFNYIKMNIDQFEGFVNEVARNNLIDNTDLSKNTFSQIILGIDLGCKDNIPLAVNYPPFMCYVAYRMFASRGYATLPKYFDFGMTEEYAKKYFNSGSEHAEKCKKQTKNILDFFFPKGHIEKR